MAARIGALQVNQTEIALKADVVAALPVGTSVMWTGDEADLPSGFMVEDGSAISRTTYSVLWGIYSEGGTVPGKNGNGDGSTTFNLANKQGIAVAGVGTQSLNGRTKTGPSDAYTKQEDHGQGFALGQGGFKLAVFQSLFGPTGTSDTNSDMVSNRNSTADMLPVDDGTNGAFRKGLEFIESRIGVYFIVRVG